jgi:hypothetical protein
MDFRESVKYICAIFEKVVLFYAYDNNLFDEDIHVTKEHEKSVSG